MDPSRPLHEQVQNARVLVPTTGMYRSQMHPLIGPQSASMCIQGLRNQQCTEIALDALNTCTYLPTSTCVVLCAGIVDRQSIYAATDLRLIAQPASGYNNIDVQAARERGVPITLAPGVNSQVCVSACVSW